MSCLCSQLFYSFIVILQIYCLEFVNPNVLCESNLRNVFFYLEFILGFSCHSLNVKTDNASKSCNLKDALLFLREKNHFTSDISE